MLEVAEVHGHVGVSAEGQADRALELGAHGQHGRAVAVQAHGAGRDGVAAGLAEEQQAS